MESAGSVVVYSEGVRDERRVFRDGVEVLDAVDTGVQMIAESVAEAGGHAGEAGEVTADFHGTVAEAGLEAVQNRGVGGDGGRQLLALQLLQVLHGQLQNVGFL